MDSLVYAKIICCRREEFQFIKVATKNTQQSIRLKLFRLSHKKLTTNGDNSFFLECRKFNSKRADSERVSNVSTNQWVFRRVRFDCYPTRTPCVLWYPPIMLVEAARDLCTCTRLIRKGELFTSWIMELSLLPHPLSFIGSVLLVGPLLSGRSWNSDFLFATFLLPRRPVFLGKSGRQAHDARWIKISEKRNRLQIQKAIKNK